MFPTITLFGIIPLSLYMVFNVLGIVAGSITMLILTIHFAKERYPKLKSKNYKSQRTKYCLSTIIIFSISYLSTSFGANYVGTLKFRGMDMKSIAFVGGLLVFIPLFMFLAYNLPQNGDVLSQLERAMPSMAIMQVFTRIGCLASGCCFGVPFEHGLKFPPTAPGIAKYGLDARLFPTQPMESIIMLICFIVMIIMIKQGKKTLHIFPIIFGIEGFINQVFTGDNRGNLYFTYIDVQQIAYIILLLIGIAFYFYRKKHEVPSNDNKKDSNIKKKNKVNHAY